MEEAEARRTRREARKRHNEEFYEQLQKRRSDAQATFERVAKKINVERAAEMVARIPRAGEEAAPPDAATLPEMVLETIVREERPVLFVQDDWINKVEVTADGEEAKELIAALDDRREKLSPLIPLIGRIDVANFPGSDFLGTGWFIDSDIVVTNRHVASLVAQPDGRRFVFRRGIANYDMVPSLGTAHEFDDLVANEERSFAVSEVLYIEPDSGPNDIAFLRVRRRADGAKPSFIPIAEADVGTNVRVVVIGYPARAPKSVIPDQAEMNRLYRNRYDVKRAAPGYTMSTENQTTRHDCTTLGGNSGSVVLDLETGRAVGLHFAGLYQESNYAVRASVLTDYIKRQVWLNAPLVGNGGPRESPPAPLSAAALPAAPVSAAVAASTDGSVSVTIPLSITVRLGTPSIQGAGQGSAASSPAAAEAAAIEFWDRRPAGVVAVRVGFTDDGVTMGDVPFIAASAPAPQLAAVQAAGPARFQGLEVRYFAADPAELVEGRPELEAAVESIAYDDSARTGQGFSFAQVDEKMSVTAHVGPEYSWDQLKGFLDGASRSLVSAIYEFHGKHIAEVLQKRLAAGISLDLVMDNATFSKVQKKDEEFARAERFKAWQTDFGNRFRRIVVPEGAQGLIANAYHIKVTVREDDTFWLSSGNWKMGSSQPLITPQQRTDAQDTDLPGNREWHVIIKNKTLSERFRNHITQDFKRSKELGGGVLPKSQEAVDILVDVPIEPVLERRPPSRLLEPLTFTRPIRVKPLLTPDKKGAVYSEAMLDLIGSAQESLLFQIPYIGMPSNPRADRGFIDQLIKALMRKLKTLRDARVILRNQGSAYSSPTHAAWYFKSKGVNVQERVRQIENHHTKGMVVDGKRVLIGSHNWSQPGVTLNRDASLIFDDREVAQYYAQAFEIDWARANPVKPKRHVKGEGVLEAVGDAPPPGYRRVRLSELLNADD